MNKKLKQELKASFHAPNPTRRDEFLKNLDFPKTTYIDFIYNQISYIRKRVWVASSLLLIGTLVSLYLRTDSNSLRTLWLVSSVLPFVVLLVITEVTRSTSYQMAELEMSCKYNLMDIVLVRLGILVGFHFLIFNILVLSMFGKMDYSFIRLGIYLLVPVLITCILSLLVLNRLKTREATYICGGISCFVSILNSIMSVSSTIIFADDFFPIWGITFCILFIVVVAQNVKLIKKMEELAWNLPLTV